MNLCGRIISRFAQYQRYHCFPMYRSLKVFVVLAFVSVMVSAQTQGGGAAAGVGRVYEAAGKSTAARELQRKMNTALIRAVAREKAVARSAADRSRPKSARPAPMPVSPPTSTDTTAFFKPDPGSNYMTAMADQLGTTAAEKEQLRQIFALTKEAFEKEVAAKGRSNNLPAAFTLFIATMVTVYHDDPEPSDEAVDKLWDGMSSALTEMPELKNLTNEEKQQMYDMLVAFSGLVLAGYTQAKMSGNAESLKVFKALSGGLIQTVLKTVPEKLRFGKGGLDIVN